MRRLRPVLPILVLAFAALLAGCTDPPPASATLLQASHRIGDDLYSWGDPQFTKPFGVGGERRIRAEFTVPGDVDRVGVAFRGSFVWPDNSTARLEVTDPGGRQYLALNATKGRMDDQGEIGGFWQFRPVLDLPPGLYKILAAGEGNVGHLEFQMHGIPRFQSSVNETFDVEETSDVELEVFVQGWGRTPRVHVTAPDGERTALDIDGPEDQVTLEWRAEPGTYRLDADTTGWGGRFVAQAHR